MVSSQRNYVKAADNQRSTAVMVFQLSDKEVDAK
jgi:hypothetical protein